MNPFSAAIAERLLDDSSADLLQKPIHPSRARGEVPPGVRRAERWVVVQFGPKKPGFFEEAGLLNRNLYHYRAMKQVLSRLPVTSLLF